MAPTTSNSIEWKDLTDDQKRLLSRLFGINNEEDLKKELPTIDGNIALKGDLVFRVVGGTREELEQLLIKFFKQVKIERVSVKASMAVGTVSIPGWKITISNVENNLKEEGNKQFVNSVLKPLLAQELQSTSTTAGQGNQTTASSNYYTREDKIIKIDGNQVIEIEKKDNQAEITIRDYSGINVGSITINDNGEIVLSNVPVGRLSKKPKETSITLPQEVFDVVSKETLVDLKYEKYTQPSQGLTFEALVIATKEDGKYYIHIWTAKNGKWRRITKEKPTGIISSSETDIKKITSTLVKQGPAYLFAEDSELKGLDIKGMVKINKRNFIIADFDLNNKPTTEDKQLKNYELGFEMQSKTPVYIIKKNQKKRKINRRLFYRVTDRDGERLSYTISNIFNFKWKKQNGKILIIPSQKESKFYTFNNSNRELAPLTFIGTAGSSSGSDGNRRVNRFVLVEKIYRPIKGDTEAQLAEVDPNKCVIKVYGLENSEYDKAILPSKVLGGKIPEGYKLLTEKRVEFNGNGTITIEVSPNRDGLTLIINHGKESKQFQIDSNSGEITEQQPIPTQY